MRDLRALATSCVHERTHTHTQHCWFKITSPGPWPQIRLSVRKGRWHILAGREPAMSLRAPQMEPSSWGRDNGAGGGYAFCTDTFTKEAQTTSTTSTFSIFMAARERDDRTGLPLIYFTPRAFFFFFLDCAYEHVWYLWERKSDSAYMQTRGSRRVHRRGRDTSTLTALPQHKRQTTESLLLQKKQKSKVSRDPWPLGSAHFTVKSGCAISHIWPDLACKRHFPPSAEATRSELSSDYCMALPFCLKIYQIVSVL